MQIDRRALLRRHGRSLLLAAFACLLSTTACFCYLYYDHHHLSASLRITLAAAMNPRNTDREIAASMHEARLEVTTTKDAEEVRRLERLIEISQSQADSYQALMLMMNGDDSVGRAEKSYRFVQHVEDQYREEGTSIPESLRLEHRRRLEEWKEAIAKRKQEQEANGRRSADEALESRRILAQLRADLKLPVSAAE